MVKQELDAFKTVQQTKDIEVRDKDTAYKKTMQKELEDLRERVDFVTKDYYQLKNDQAGQIALASKNVHYLQEAMSAVQVTTTEHDRRIAFFDSLKELKSPDKDLRKCITDYILDEWQNRYDEQFIRSEIVHRMIGELKEYNKENSGVVNRLETIVKNIQSEYILADTVEQILQGYADVETVDELRNQMKQMPTLSALELRLKTVTDTIEETKVNIKKKYCTKSYMEERFETIKDTFEQTFVSKADFKNEQLRLEASIGDVKKAIDKIKKTQGD